MWAQRGVRARMAAVRARVEGAARLPAGEGRFPDVERILDLGQPTKGGGQVLACAIEEFRACSGWICASVGR